MARGKQMTTGGFRPRSIWLALLALGIAMHPVRSTAQTKVPAAPVEIPRQLTPEQVDGILADLTDAQVRQLLSRELHQRAQREAAAQRSVNGGLGVLLVQLRLAVERLADTLRQRAAQVTRGMAVLPEELTASIDKVAGGGGTAGILGQIALLLGLLALGAAAHLAVQRLTRQARRQIEVPAGDGLFDRICGASFRAAFDLLAILAFAVVGFGLAFLLYHQSGPDRTFLTTFLTGALITYGAALVARFVLAPGVPALRLAPLGDKAARFLYRWSVLLAGVAVFAWLAVGLLILTGMALEAHLMLVLITGAIMVALLIAMVFQCRRGVAAVLRGGAPSAETKVAGGRTAAARDRERPLRVLFADTWHVFAIVYVIVIWLLWAMSMLARGPTTIWAATASVGVVLLFPLLDRLSRRVFGELFGGAECEGDAPAANATTVARRAVRLILVVVLGAIVLELWGVNLSGGMGAKTQSALREASFDIAVAVLLAYLGWQMIKLGIDRRLAPREVNGVTIEPNARMRTLLPLARKFFVVVLISITIMLILSALGIDIGPLLAGAGVVGLAIGFGAQTLVRDVMSGIFFLIEDAFRVGEYVELGGELRGEVEAISLRSLRLRHHRGPIHTIPFGELRSITNHNRDWVIYKMSFRVPFDTDIDKVKKLMKVVGAEMMADPELGPKLIEPLKSQGVTEIDDSALIIRVKFMCLPREQFVLRREAYQRIKACFEANGIEFARRKVEVHTPPTGGKGEAGAPGGQAAAAALAGEADGKAAQT